MDPKTVQKILKVASLKLVEQQNLINDQSVQLANYEFRKRAEELTDRMIDNGHLDFSDRENKIEELLMHPDDMGVVEKALELASNPSTFKLASLSDRDSLNGGPRHKLETYLLSGE